MRKIKLKFQYWICRRWQKNNFEESTTVPIFEYDGWNPLELVLISTVLQNVACFSETVKWNLGYFFMIFGALVREVVLPSKLYVNSRGLAVFYFSLLIWDTHFRNSPQSIKRTVLEWILNFLQVSFENEIS